MHIPGLAVSGALLAALVLLAAFLLFARKKVNAVFWELDKRYKGIFSVSTDPLLLVDQQSAAILKANPAACSLYGYTSQEMERLKTVDISAEPEETLRTMRELCTNIQRRNHKRKDGAVLPVAIAANYFTIRGRRVILASIRDMQSLVRSEEALRETEARFRATFRSLAESESRLKRAQEIAHVGNWELDLDTLRVWGSEECFRIFGFDYDAKDPTMRFDTAMDAVLPQDRALVEKALAGIAKNGGSYDIVFGLRRMSGGRGCRVHSRAQSVPDAQGRPAKVLGVLQDITDTWLAEEALKASEAKHRAMIANSTDVISIIGADGIVRYISPNIEKLFGRRPEELVGGNGFEVLHPEDAARLAKRFAELVRLKNGSGSEICRYRHVSGEYRIVEATATNMLDNPDIRGVLVNYRDITEKRRQEEQILRISYHDSLTGLFNRTYFERELKRLDEGELPYSVVMCDINGLKLTNDVFGHAEGDRLLVHVAGLLSGCCRAGGAAARMGGDEFCLLLPGASEAAARLVCDGIVKACRGCEIVTEKGTYGPSISLGYATKSSRDQTAERVLRDAEDFMYKRKLLERNSMHSSLIASIRATMFEKSHETKEHADRLVAHSRAVGERLGLSEGQLNELELLAQLHDIGKISVDARILASPCKLSAEDWEEIKKHPEVGYRIALASPELKPIADGILSHHERWDGGGYPQKLKGTDIPLLARILSVVDAYDAMTNDRAYRRAMTKAEALREIERGAGEQFDPEVVGIFLEIA